MGHLAPCASPPVSLKTDLNQDLGEVQVKALRRMYQHHFADFFSEKAQLKNVLTAMPNSVPANYALTSDIARPE